jgi:MoaD family protein
MAQAKVRTFAGMREILGGKEIDFQIGSDETIGSLIEKLTKTYGKAFENQIKDPVTGDMIPVLIMVNDRVYRSIVDLGEKVIDGDTVTILIPFDGGALGGKTFRLHE